MSARPVFSVIIPTFNRPNQLAYCLDSFMRVTYPDSHFEVIVVDDGGNSPTGVGLSSYHDRLNLTFLYRPHLGPAAARNAGAKKAAGRYLAFIDDDCIPASDWLQNLENRITSSSNITMVGGQTINALTDNIYAAASQHLIRFLYDYYNADKKHARFLTTSNVAVPAEPFHSIGGFDPGYRLAAAEDRDFCHRWRLNGYAMCYDPDIIVQHRHHLTLRTFWKQHFNYGRGAHRFHRVCIRQPRAVPRLEPISFYIKLMLYPFLKVRTPRPVMITLLLILSQIGNAAGFFRDAQERSGSVGLGFQIE